MGKQRCVSESNAYNQCLKDNGGLPQDQMVERCKDILRMLHECTHRRLSTDGAVGSKVAEK